VGGELDGIPEGKLVWSIDWPSLDDADERLLLLLFCDRTATGTMTIPITTSADNARTTTACLDQTIVTSLS
jgi:hypothetical protein